jgi:hypothetical protein
MLWNKQTNLQLLQKFISIYLQALIKNNILSVWCHKCLFQTGKSSTKEETYSRRCLHYYACICAFASDDKLSQEFGYYINLETQSDISEHSKFFFQLWPILYYLLFRDVLLYLYCNLVIRNCTEVYISFTLFHCEL